MTGRLGTALLLLAPVLGSTGCVAGGLAAVGPLVGAVQAIADRSVERTLAGDLATVWAATNDALGRMALNVEQTDRTGDVWLLTGKGDRLTVSAEVRRVTPRMTRVSLQVEAGRLLADKQTGETLLDQVARSLAEIAPSDALARRQRTADESLAALQREIRTLRSTLDEVGAGSRPAGPPAPAAPAMTVDPGGVLAVPVSSGVPTLAGPPPVSPPAVEPQRAGPVRVAAPVAAASRAPAHTAAPTPSPTAPIEATSALAPAPALSPLTPVEVLRPVEALSSPRSGL